MQDSEEAISALMKAGGFIFPVMLDVDEVFRAYGVDVLPTTVVIDSEGRIVETIPGAVTADQLSATIDSLVD